MHAEYRYRCFAIWSLAYAGSALGVERIITMPPIGAAVPCRRADGLFGLPAHFSSWGGKSILKSEYSAGVPKGRKPSRPACRPISVE